jgi:two-component system phosphate regulon response regulator PhoB
MKRVASGDADIVAGLELGAEDYVTKPFSPRVLVARVRRLLRRVREAKREAEGILRRGDLVIDPERFEVRVAGRPVELTATEFAVLLALARRPGWVLRRSQIIDLVKGEDYPVTERAVDVHIANIRRKLGPLRARIETVRGVGYRFRE